MITSYRGPALLIAHQIPHILKQRGLDPHVISRYDLWQGAGGSVWLSVVLNAGLLNKPEQYLNENTAHHISTVLSEKAKRKIPVLPSNSDGARLAILLSKPPQLPKALPAPAWKKGIVQIGADLQGAITSEWSHEESGIGHVMTCAENQYGKSTFLKHLASQALQEGFRLVLVDPRNATFPPLRGHHQVDAYIATPEDSVAFLAAQLLPFMHARAKIFQHHGVDKFEKLPEGTLPRLVICIEEYNEIIKTAEIQMVNQRKAVSRSVLTMALGCAKYGIHLIVAGHYFQQDEADRLKDQFRTKIVFRLENKAAARMLIDNDLPTRIWTKGRAMTNRWGLIQTYYTELEAQPTGDGLTETERGLMARLKAEWDGRATYPALQALGYARKAAEKLREDRVQRGLARFDPTQDNALILTI